MEADEGEGGVVTQEAVWCPAALARHRDDRGWTLASAVIQGR